MIVKHIAREQITISSTAKNLDADGSGTLFTETNKKRIRYADVQITSQNVRVTYDGSTAPVKDTTGNIWYSGQVKRVWGMTLIEAIQFIKDATSDAVLIVDYFGTPV